MLTLYSDDNQYNDNLLLGSYLYKDMRLVAVPYRYDNVLFEDYNQYLDYLTSKNIPCRSTQMFMNYPDACDTAEGIATEIQLSIDGKSSVYDNVRDFSIFNFKTVEDAAQFIMFMYKHPQCLSASTCPYVTPLTRRIHVNMGSPKEPSGKEWSNIAHFVISYLPDDKDKRKARKDAFTNYIKSCFSVTPHARIYAVVQNFKKSDLINDSRITYSRFDKGIGAAKARNYALKLLYESNYNFGILSDDDVICHYNQTSVNFFEELEKGHFDKAPIDIVTPIDLDTYHPEIAQWDASRRSCEWTFYPKKNGWFHFTVFRNLRKFYGKEEYQREDVNHNKLEFFDDCDFYLALQERGYKSHLSGNLMVSTQLNDLVSSVVYDVPQHPQDYYECLINTMRMHYSVDKRSEWEQNYMSDEYSQLREQSVDFTTELVEVGLHLRSPLLDNSI